MQNDNNFSEVLTGWYAGHKRDLPWRQTTNPYQIWLSEIMLQQTQVSQGLPYYLKFTETYPTVFHLAKASQEEVLKNWQGLGYYSRARNLHETAKIISTKYNGLIQGLIPVSGLIPVTLLTLKWPVAIFTKFSRSFINISCLYFCFLISTIFGKWIIRHRTLAAFFCFLCAIIFLPHFLILFASERR